MTEVKVLTCSLCELGFDGRAPHYDEQVIDKQGELHTTILCKPCEQAIEAHFGREIEFGFKDVQAYKDRP